MTLSSFATLGLLFITARLPAEVDAAPCFLCKDYHEMPSRVDCVLDPDTGKTCFDLYTQLLLNEDWSQCLDNQHAYQDACCGDDADNLCYTGPTSSPVYNGEIGDEPTCNICGTEVSPKPIFDCINCTIYDFISHLLLLRQLFRNFQGNRCIYSPQDMLERIVVVNTMIVAYTDSFQVIYVDHFKIMPKKHVGAVNTIRIVSRTQRNAMGTHQSTNLE
jgi:hypothetical protein